MRKLKSKEKFNASRGLGFIIKFPNPDRLTICPNLPSVGELVLIDGKRYEVRGIESSMKLINPPVMEEHVGILVRDVV